MVKSEIACSAAEVQELFALRTPIRTFSGDTHRPFRIAHQNLVEVKLNIQGILSHDVEDQVVSCRANTSIQELQSELARKGQCLPYLPFHLKYDGALEQVRGTVAGHLAMNLPHGYEARCGTWKSWLLGAKLILPDGLNAKSGSKAVKNVAGYDVHKFLVGSRGAFCVFTELTLKTYPLKALSNPDCQILRDRGPLKGAIQRTLPVHFSKAVEAANGSLIGTHRETCTLYREIGEMSEIERTPEDWVLGWGFGNGNLEPRGEATARYLRLTKQMFDPCSVLNPGEFGESRE
jgi:hypothetical protein